MKFRSLVSLAVLASGVATLGIAAPAHAKWKRAETKHFIAYSESSEEDLRTRLERLEKFDALMRKLLNVDDTLKVQVFVVPSVAYVQRLAGSRSVGGFYSASAQLAYAVVPEKLPYYVKGFTPESILLHEYTHHMLLSGTDRYVPGWATEGLAEMFSTARYDNDGGLTIGAPNPSRSYSMYGASRWSVDELLKSDQEKIKGDERIELYSRGWVMAHYLWLSGERPGQYVEFLKLLNSSGDPIESGKKAFGDLDKLNKELNAYLRRSTFPASKFSAEQLDAPLEVEMRDATPGEDAILEYRLVSLIGVDKERSLKLVAEARPVGARFPDDPFVQRTMAEIEYDAASLNEPHDYSYAEAAADRALAADPDNLMGMVYKGRIAAKRAMKGEGDWDTARAWFLKANKVDPNNALPFMLYYDSFEGEGVDAPEGAVGGLYRATVLMPQDLTLRARSALELIKASDIKRAREVLAPAAFSPHAPQDNPMRQLIAKIDEGADRDALLTWVRDEKFDKRYNDFFQTEIAQEDEKKEKEGGDKKDD